MKAYTLIMGLIIFQACIVICGSLGITGPMTGTILDWSYFADWRALLGALPTALLIPAGIMLRVNIGALVFAGAFCVSNYPFSATVVRLVDLGIIPPAMASTLVLLMWLAFLWGFIQLSSAPVERW